MPVSRERRGHNVVYTITGPFDEIAANEYQDLNAIDYNTIGNALGAIIDARHAYVTVRGLRAIQKRLGNVVFDVPVAFIGYQDSVFATFMRGLEILTSRGSKKRFQFVNNVDEAVRWIDEWFELNKKDRLSLVGQVTTKIEPLNPDRPNESETP
ncbi:MAG: hypothetical protein H6662_10465 [Ardenticatenaceae bacterium]|nr:hypothetical protein [Anaerolineales bacterium]MCB8921997.1 hypothetical protein [Ardenticatenaceae bacterium]MCB8989573.1 hypothetical protein [Ardenticatenaceae bacterium]MCB9003116.1 hypothetical protein [Ardenticatenaceae bacterium]